MESDWIEVAQLTNLQSVAIAMALLDENGIEAVAINKKDSATALFGFVQIMVNRNDSASANELLASIKN